MAESQGNRFPDRGVILEVVENARLFVSDAYVSAREPSAKPFMTRVVSFARDAGGCRYTAVDRHGSVADRQAHEAMGFHQGRGICADQRATLAEPLRHIASRPKMKKGRPRGRPSSRPANRSRADHMRWRR